LTVRPYWLWPPPARACFTRAGFEVHRVPLRRVVRASVQRRRPRSSACASAHRPATARASFGASNGAPALRVELAPPVRSVAPLHECASRARRLNGWTVDRTPLLRFRVPCSARLPRRACVCAGRRHLSGDPASTVDPRRRPPSPLVSRSRACEHRAMLVHTLSRHRAPTHRRRWLSLRFYAWRSWPGRLCADRRRAFWPGRFAVLVAPLHRTRPSPPRVMRRRILVQPAFRYPRFGLRGLVGPLFGVAKLAWVSVP
jgi:hypothetical protein